MTFHHVRATFLLFDAAKYVVAAGAILKSLYPKLFHVTCVAPLLHSFGTKVKSHFEDVDQRFLDCFLSIDI